MCLIDVCAGAGHEKAFFGGYSPCLTKSRPSGFFVSILKRSMNVNEIGRLQGMDKAVIHELRKASSDMSLAGPNNLH